MQIPTLSGSVLNANQHTRDIQGHVGELYGITISPDLVSAVTDSVIDEVRAWQSRPLESTYALVFFDALRVKIRDEGLVRNKAVYLAIGMRCSGHKDILGLWIEQTEGAKFWLRVMNELRSRGLNDVLIAVVDGLKGFPDSSAKKAVLDSTGRCNTRLQPICRRFKVQRFPWSLVETPRAFVELGPRVNG